MNLSGVLFLPVTPFDGDGAVAAEPPVIVHQRDSVVLDPADVVEPARVPGAIGPKDGLGDVDRPRLRGLEVGPVLPPLTDLDTLIETGLSLVAA
ncbi:hypothetical protein AB0B45_20105 [Nonomuraea sp. NPDC049152]|uniref:hypothetical protein n=1 Tax=Nonomuraea sp. NPDC049152 TaxID=3154350 RepID=UPI0033FEE492